MNFRDIPSELVNEIIKNVDISGFMEILDNKTTISNINYNIVITGSVGVGKSTIAQLTYEILKDLFNNVQIYPEYISYKLKDVSIGNLMLDLKINKLITAETFQHFVLDIWEHQLQHKGFSNENCINILERLPEDAVTCFTKESYMSGEISKLGWDNINKRLKNINKKYKVPINSECKFAIIDNNNKLVNAVQEIINIIIDDIKNGVKNRVFGLIVDDDEYMKRIITRGRDSELNNKMDIYKHYNEFYSDLYNKLSFK